MEVSNGSDRPEPGEQPTAPAPEHGEARPEAETSDAGAEPVDQAAGGAEPTEPAPSDPGSGVASESPQPGYGPQGDQPPGYGQPAHGGGPGGQAPRPGIVPLRPLAAGDVLAGAVGYIRANPVATLGVSAAVLVVGQTLRAIIEFVLPSADPAGLAAGRVGGLIGWVLGVVGGVVVNVALGAVLTGLLLAVLSRAVLGQRVDVREAWHAVARRLPGLIGLSLLIVVLIGMIFLILTLPSLVVAGRGSGTAIGLAALLVLGAFAITVHLAVLWAPAPAAYVLEPIGVTEALRRSGWLVHGSWWRTFGILLLTAFLLAVPAISVLGMFDMLSYGPPDGRVIQSAIAYAIIGTFVIPVLTGVTGLLYLDQRIRRERLDLELARSAG